MQEGYVFNDTIANNIAVGEDYIDKQKLRKAVDIANIKEFIEGLPLSYNTKIGNEGIGVSGGQKQRLFIARAVYKSPEYIFLMRRLVPWMLIMRKSLWKTWSSFQR